MNPFYELEEFRSKLWDCFITTQKSCEGGVKDVSFNRFWYHFLLLHIASEETPLELIYEEVCTAIESNVVPQSCYPAIISY